ncbi:hypothetical protein BJ138DRAFT_1069585 [Hygrophoropsis aurantiaca]|uniref:Uncharacterized protein n=1 Tax=Hygrophoropsis aurantiaca TaxID=72124 RepID=A0ACB8A4J1_9AGAM|nr:hypothetical protein BJ138DRAFT_1069585 [Hygrophoropsis aurantiaca]
MHQCHLCPKSFPRPSGLKTHMNSHTGSKPYKCSVPSCGKTFAVRSNAKRHLRTHGINPSTCDSSPPGSRFTVGFEEPVVTQVHDSGKRPMTIKWIPQSLATRTRMDWLTSSPPSAGIEESDETLTSYPILQTPLPAVVSSQSDYGSGDEERDSRIEASEYPYHPSQYRGLPGPAPK